ARRLVDDGTLRYERGLWHVPEFIGEREVPRALLEPLADLLQSLSPEARILAEALSVHQGELPLHVCVHISRPDGEQQVSLAIAELGRKAVLAEGSGRIRFLHGGFRGALAHALPEARRRALHRKVGEALLAAPGAAERDGEIGWHLLQGGDEVRG